MGMSGFILKLLISVADPGFSRGAGANSPGGAPTYDFGKISQKLHEIERIWTPREDARPKFYYVNPPLDIDLFYYQLNSNDFSNIMIVDLVPFFFLHLFYTRALAF